MFEYIGGAAAIGFVIWAINRYFNPRLDLNKEEDQVVLDSLFAIVHQMDGPSDKLDKMVKVVRKALGQPTMQEDRILKLHHRAPTELSVTDVRSLSSRKRMVVLILACRIKFSDGPAETEEDSRWLEDLVGVLGLRAEMDSLYELVDEISESGHEVEGLSLLKNRNPHKSSLDLLGLETDATDEEIKEACKKQMMEAHPDRERNPEKKKEAEQRFKDIQAACKILGVRKSPGNKR